ncbi:elongator complex protein 6-like [Saccoglossus kowalevskii]|uniref:Elongator complex protein 6 n=1 Tax=Saccoglossus kowalevskii TaxID=10224 RepID=A0ABM0GU95_SACKO|nr:PREDICTED: elongator complex protein 6-like [Saccoglossus kowalevskii]
MFTELNALLDCIPSRPPKGQFILLSDNLTDGTFILHHYISLFLKGGHKVCLVSLSQSFSHYNAVGQKLGVNLSLAKEKNQLVFIDGLQCSLQLFASSDDSMQNNPLVCIRDSKTTLQPLYEMVRNAVCNSDGKVETPVLLLIDDLSILLSLGISLISVYDFMHYCVVMLCGSIQSVGCLVTLIHSDKDEENSLLLRHLLYSSHLHLHMNGLSSGFCKDVHGELSIHWNDPWQILPSRQRRKIYQYKIQDKHVSFFAPGTSAAVL